MGSVSAPSNIRQMLREDVSRRRLDDRKGQAPLNGQRFILRPSGVKSEPAHRVLLSPPALSALDGDGR